jgi:hypothetical protein
MYFYLKLLQPLVFNAYLSKQTIKHQRKDLNLLSSRSVTLSYTEMVQLVIAALDADPGQTQGLANIKLRIAFNHGIHLTRDFISEVMHAIDPNGFEDRDPGSKKILRIPKVPIGIHERWSGDGHDKLYSIGFPIWAVVDEATSRWLDGWVVPSNRLANVIGYLFLDLVERFGGNFLYIFVIY